MHVAENNFLSKLRNAYNVFRYGQEVRADGPEYSLPRHRSNLKYGNEKSLVGAIYNRISLGVATLSFRHARVDDDDMYVETIESGLNRCLTVEANIDQSFRAFMQDVVISMLDEGVVAIVPTDTSVSLSSGGVFDVLSLRTGKIIGWKPYHVRIRLYNEAKGDTDEITLPKSQVAIIENPFYSVMNEKSSVLKRLISKLNLLDVVDEQSSSGKLDIIIQLPYAVKSEARKKQAEERRQAMDEQLKNSKYGVAYSDANEKVIQLNRAAQNNLMEQVEKLTSMLYGQLGISEAILDGTAKENELVTFFNHTIEPIVMAITAEMRRKFLSKTAISQKQKIMHFRNLLSIVSPTTLADTADKLTRNEIVSPNNIRALVGLLPSKAAGANELRNRNIAQPKDDQPENNQPTESPIDVTSEIQQIKKKE